MVVDPANSTTIYAVAAQGAARQLFKSTDGGASFTRLDFGGPNSVNRLVLDPGDPGVLLVLTDSRVFRSSNGGVRGRGLPLDQYRGIVRGGQPGPRDDRPGDVGFDLRVVDTLTGRRRTYSNPDRTPAAPVTDTGAFATCDVRSEGMARMPPVVVEKGGTCAADRRAPGVAQSRRQRCRPGERHRGVRHL